MAAAANVTVPHFCYPALLSDEVRRPLEVLMHFEGNQLDVEMFRYHYVEGEKAGHAEGLRTLLSDQLTERFGPLPEAARRQLQEASPEVLARWGRRVLSAASLDDVLASAPWSADWFALGREHADLLRIAALLRTHWHWERPSSLVAPCSARNCAFSLGRANRSAP